MTTMKGTMLLVMIVVVLVMVILMLSRRHCRHYNRHPVSTETIMTSPRPKPSSTAASRRKCRC